MTEYHSKPQPGDKRNVSQDDILQNFLYLAGTVESPNTGIITVDHNSSGNTATGPTDGYHKQVSMNAKAQPANRQNIVNGQTADIILYAKNDTLLTNPKPQLNVLTSTGASPTVNYQVTPCLPLRASAVFNGVSGVIISSFNVTSIVKIATGQFTITFTDQLPSDSYYFLGTAMPRGSAVSAALRVATVQALADDLYSNSITSSFFKVQACVSGISVDTTRISIMFFGG